MSRTPSDSETRWCPTCGSIVPPERDACPHCGMPMPQARPAHAAPEPTEEEMEERPTSFLPRLGSAIPDAGPQRVEAPRRQRSTLAFILAAICAVAVLGGSFLLIFHPWNPDLLDTRAQEPADTSMDGFPGAIDRLQGQDTDGAVGVTVTSQEATYRDLSDALLRLDDYAAELNEEFQVLDQDFAADPAVRQADADTARRTSIAISNLISRIEDLDMSSGVYLESQRTLVRLGNYLRNRADALTGAWEVSLASGDPTNEKLRALSDATATDESYAVLFQDARRDLQIPEPSG